MEASRLSVSDQRRLLAFLTDSLDKRPSSEAASARSDLSEMKALHPELLPMVGILPEQADPADVHEFRLLTHS